MRRRGTERGYFELRTCSGKKTAGSSTVKGDVDKVVIIDLDGEDVTEVEYGQSLQPPSRTSSTLRKDKQSRKSTFIYIDDDEDSPVICVEDLGDVDSDATSTKSSFPASDHRQKSSVTSDSDECQVFREKGSSSKGSKCKQTNSAKAPSRNRYGFGVDSESDSFQSDCSDCELIEACTAKLHEHWERVSRKRKPVPNNFQSASEDQVSGSGSHSDTAEVEDRTAYAEIPVCSSSENGNHEKENFQNSMGPGDRHFKGKFDTPINGSFSESNKKVSEERECLHRNDSLQHGKGIVIEDPLEWTSYLNDGISGLWNEEKSLERPSSCSTEELGGKQSKHPGTCSSDNVVGNGTYISDSLWESSKFQKKVTVLDEEILIRQNQYCGEILSDHVKVELNGKDHEFHDAPTCSASPLNEFRKGTRSEEIDNAVSGQPSEELHMNCGVAVPDDRLGVPGDSLFFNKLYEDKSETSNKKACYLEKVRADSEEVSVCNTLCNQTRSNHGGLVDSSKGKELCNLRDQFHAQDGDVSPVLRGIVTIERDIINDREKLKETAEYKRAVDEEMASRQQALQIQSEEAQRLRKRKKAENMRLLDMQQRQKQRVEEVRETQKKDQENLNLKDQIRAEVRTELKRLEFTCIDMASLLRGLGIQVGAGLRALPKEVHAAYKRALLKFHPDRASRTDIRQQVESEEKFKLISRMKEKLMLTSCY